MTLLGTAEVDCLLRDGEAVACLSRGDNDLEASDRDDKSDPREGDKLFTLLCLLKTPPPGWKGSVTARGRDLGRPN